MTDEGVPGYGRFGVLSRVELERFCYLDDEDRRLIAVRRRDYNRLGFAVQVVTVRYLGMFLADPVAVPSELVAYLGEQLDIDDPSCLGEYMVRRTTRFEHQAEIVTSYGLVAFADAEAELAGWIADQAWITGDGPKAIFDGAVAWCRARRVLLPGVTTLDKLVAAGREAAEQRLWAQLAGQVSGSAAGTLLGWLEVPAGVKQRVSELDRLRKGVFRPSSKGMLAALERVGDLTVAGSAGVDVSGVPPRRLLGLAQHGLSGKASVLRRMSREHRLAVLVATVSVLGARAADDVLELFDLLMTTELLSKAERESKDEKLRRYPRVSRNAGRLAEAVGVLLDMVEIDQDVALSVVWDLIEAKVSGAELRSAVAVITELVPAGDAELDSQHAEELAGRFATVRPFLPRLMRVISFGATADGAPVLAAMKTLAAMIQVRSGKPGARWFDARAVDHDLVGGAWSRLVYPDGRPAETVDRAAYTFCVLEQFHRHLKHRNIFAESSSKWRDPRAHLLAGASWESAREAGLNALGLPSEATVMLAAHAEALDAALREVAARLDADTPATVDDEGKLHAAALVAVPDPPSLTDLRRRVEAMLPRIDLPELVLEVMSWQPGFTEAFTHASGNPARVADLGLSVAAVLCAHAMNVGFGPVTSPGVEALTRDRLHHVDQSYIRFDTLAAANVTLIEAQARIPLAQVWGGGLVASVDGLRFVVPVRTIHARPNAKYFGRGRGITWLNMINDQAAGLAAQVLSGTPRDSLHAVDVVLRQQGWDGARGDHHRHRLLQRHRVRVAAPARAPVPAAAGEPARSTVVAHRPGRGLRAAGPGRARAHRCGPDRPSLGGHVPDRGLDPRR